MEKKLKKALTMLLAVLMLTSTMSIPVFAEEMGSDTGDQDTAITGTINENTEWKDGDVIGDVTIADDVTITVNGEVTVAGTIRLAPDAICDVTFNGENDAKLIRGGGFTGQMFYAEGTICYFQNLTFNNITLDGGAVWTDEVDAILGRGTTNEGVKATGSVLYLVRANAILNNSVLQNHDDSTGEQANAVFLREYATVAFYNSVARNNNSPSGYWKGGVVTTRYGGSVTAKDSVVYGNSASHGGFVGISSSGSYGAKVECENTVFHNNYASTAGAVFYLQENGSKILKTHGDNRSGYLKLTGCTLEYNGSPDGLIYSYVYYMPAWIKDTTIANNACAVYTYHSDNRSFSVAGSTQISGDHRDSLYENPVRIYGALDSDASILMSEESVNHLMTQYGYLVTAAPAIPYDYNHTGKIQNAVIPYEYTSKAMYDLTLDDLAQVELPENSGYTNWVLTDVDGNGMLDAVPVSTAPTTVNVTLIDKFDGTEVSQTVAVSNMVKNVPVCEYEHAGYYFTGWAMEDGTLIKDAASAAILAEGAVLTATWAVARPVVSIDPQPYVIMLEVGDSVELTASIDNENEEDLSYTYQWYRAGAAIDGATETTYTATEAEAGDYVYKCVAIASNDTYGSNTYNKNILLHYDEPEVEAPVKDYVVNFESGTASHICFLYIDKETGEVVYDSKIDFNDGDTSAEIPAKDGYISAVFIKQAKSGMIWTSEEITDEAVQQAIVDSIIENDPAYKGHSDVIVSGEGSHNLTYNIGNGKKAKTQTVTYIFE